MEPTTAIAATPSIDLADVMEKIARLEREIAVLRGSAPGSEPVAERIAESPAGPVVAPDVAPAVEPVVGAAIAEDVRTDRRTLLRRAGAAAAFGAVAATAATVGQSTPAAAADGETLKAGGWHKATSPTLLECAATPANAYSYPFALNVLPKNDLTGALMLGRGRAHLTLHTTGKPPMEDDQPQLSGSIVADENQDVWYAVSSGTDADFRKMTGPDVAGSLHVLDSPVRVYDSRPGEGPDVGAQTKISNGEERVVGMGVWWGAGAPARTRAVLVNLTVTQTSAAGWIAAFKNGVAWGGASNLNWSAANQTMANMAVVNVDTARRITVRAAGSAHVIVDVVGYYL